LRLVALNGKSGYSTTMGLRPFDISTGPIDRVLAETVLEKKPVLSILPMSAPDAAQQIVSGIYSVENGQYRWMAQKAVVLLKTPGATASLMLHLYIPDSAPARRVTAIVNGTEVARENYPAPGAYTLTSGPIALAGDTSTVELLVDKAFS